MHILASKSFTIVLNFRVFGNAIYFGTQLNNKNISILIYFFKLEMVVKNENFRLFSIFINFKNVIKTMNDEYIKSLIITKSKSILIQL